MGLPISQQAKYWGLAALVFLVLMYLMGNVLVPFLVGGAIAYFLDPIADRLERMGMSRVAATAVITLVMFLVVVLLVLAVIPTLIQQTAALVNAAPEIARNLQTFLTDRFPDLLDETSIMRKTLADIGDFIQSKGADLAQGLISSAMSVLSAVIFIVVVPVVAFYLLLDWDKMVARIDALIPRDHVATVRRLAGEIDKVLAGFVRGQLTVCLIVGAYYSVTLMLAGLQFGLVVGAIAGAVSFIPYVGAIIGGILAIGLALFQFWGDWLAIGIVVAIFVMGQFIEGNILTPKLVGNSVGLHPVWLLLALSAFGSLLGFAGMLIAVPVAAALGVLMRFVTAQYQASLLYSGVASTAEIPLPVVRDEDAR
ncbi:MAG: AI-2E family transporter [Pseudotabrizicola sp.]|uniref:AI-2E family transporter n=1 Tax=Pseudotabrizicola sp. TaxID=2939647 RepID=UPI002723F2DE|nr:AI-2E family transporter [Pseudotabrizicola sp.]MDO8884225.1 AI-2E family transporter [Pseudotabrizicola sp.]MDP2080556.1 AI-2E family transporter [Pseudotabrizicola sp.]MDZ7573284.1 AI-2E family transporter [Pseudotabrizicola sp.]